MDLCLQILDIKPQLSIIKNNPKDNISIVFLYDNTHITIANLEKFISKSEKIHCRLNTSQKNNKNKLNINSKIKLNNIDFTLLENATNIMGYGDIEPSTDIKWINVINNELNKNKNVIGTNLCQLQIKTVIKNVSNKQNIFSASPGQRNSKKTIYSSASSMKDNNEINNALLTNSTIKDLENSFKLTNNNNNKNSLIKKYKKTIKCFSPKNINKKIGLSPLSPKLKNFNFRENFNNTTKHKRAYNRSTEHINYNQIYNDNNFITNNIKTKMNNTNYNSKNKSKNNLFFNNEKIYNSNRNNNNNKLINSYEFEKFNTIDNKNKTDKKIDPKILYKIIEDEIFDQNIKTEITKDDMILSSDDDIFNTKFKFNKPILKSATSSDNINFNKNNIKNNVINVNNYTSNNENDFENIKHDFMLFYTKEYLNNIKKDSLKIEILLLLEKMFDIQNVFNKQFIFLYKNNIENKNYYKLCCEKFTILNKKTDKIKALKRKEKLKEYDKINNKDFIKEIELKYVDLRKQEINIWNYSLNKCNKIKNNNNNNKNETLNEKKKNLINIFLLIVENKQNKLSTLSKKFFIQLKTKYNNINNINNNNNNQKNNNNNKLYNSPANKRKKINNNNNNGKEIGTPSTNYSPSSSIINYSKVLNKNNQMRKSSYNKKNN